MKDMGNGAKGNIGMIKRLEVKRTKEGHQAKYRFNWRGLPEEQPSDKDLSDICYVFMENFRWENGPALDVKPTDVAREFEVTLNW